METPVQTAVRLLDALEDLASQEAALLHTPDFVDAAAVQKRATPLVERLAALAVDPAVAALRSRVAVLIEKYQQNSHFFSTQLQRLQAELRRIDEARSRVAQVAPAYRGGNSPVSRLNAAA